MINTDLNYLVCTVYGEARGEPIEGQIAVANVIKNRAYASQKTYKDICLAPRQFSCWNQDDPNRSSVLNLLISLEAGDIITDLTIRQIVIICKAIYENGFKDNSHGARNYVSTARYKQAQDRKGKDDQWILSMHPATVLGNHTFLV